MKCIDCQQDMMEFRCACGAAWLSDEQLLEMAQEMKSSVVALPWQAREGEQRCCPQCSAAMLTVSLDGVALDRCDGHGIWFDAQELEAVLQRAVSFPEPRDHNGWAGKIPRKGWFDDGVKSPKGYGDTAGTVVLGLGVLLDLIS